MNLKNIKLTWKKLIIFAILIGIYTGIVVLLPISGNISIKDISVSFEWWILFGILIILNSNSNKDSAMKCFIFFLISQPIVYLMQVPYNGFKIFMYYIPWLKWTILTIPMGYIGYYMKKDNLLGLSILTPILLLLGLHIYNFSKETIYFFPNHLLSLIFCITTMYIYIYGIFTQKKERIIGTIICTIIILISILLNVIPKFKTNTTYNTILKCSDEELILDSSSKVYLNDSKYGNVYIDINNAFDGDVYCINAEFKKIGETEMTIESNNKIYKYNIKINRNSYELTEIE